MTYSGWWARLRSGDGQRLFVSSALQGVFDPIVSPNRAPRAPGFGPLEGQDGPVFVHLTAVGSPSIGCYRGNHLVLCLASTALGFDATTLVASTTA